MKKYFIQMLTISLVCFLFAFVLTGCTEADRVSTNLSQQADNFNVTGRLAVINARTDNPVFELIGNFSISTNNATNELTIVCETAPVYIRNISFILAKM